MADEDKLINVVVKYSTQGADAAAQSYVLQGKAADDFYKKQHNTWDAMGKDYEKFQSGYKQGNEEAAKSIKKFTDQVEQDSKRASAQISEVNKQFQSMRNTARDLNQIGNLFGVAGGLITGGILASANNYAQTMGQINSKSAEWLHYQHEIKEANLQIGEVAMNAMLPAMKGAADLMQKVADIAKENPWLVQGALTVGGIMTALALGTKLIAGLINVTADIGMLIAKAEAAGLTNAAGKYGVTGGMIGPAEAGAGSISALVSTASLVLAGVVASGIAVDLVNKILDQTGASKAIAEAQEKIKETSTNRPYPGVITSARPGSENVSQPAVSAQISQINQQEVNAFIAFQKQKVAAEQQYEQQRSDIIKQYGKQRAEMEAQYEAQRAQIIANTNAQIATETRDFHQQQATNERNFNQQQAKALASYQESVQKSNAEFNKSQQRAQQAHQVEMQRFEQEHNLRLDEFAAQRDALGLAKEQRNYDTQKSQKDQDFKLQQQQARQEHQQQLADQRIAFERQRADAIANYNQQRADAQAAFDQRVADQRAAEAQQLAALANQHKIEMAKAEEAEKEKLSAMDKAYKKQVDLMQTAFVDRLRSIDQYVLGDYNAFQKYMEDASVQFQSWLANYQSTMMGALSSSSLGTASGGAASSTGTSSNTQTGTYHPYLGWYASGGYAPYGQYVLGDAPGGGKGDDEFVLKGSTTKAMESLLGGKLTQESLIAGVMAARNPQYSQGGKNANIVITGKSLTIKEIRSEIQNSLGDVVPHLMNALGITR